MDYTRWSQLMARLALGPNEQTFNKLRVLYSEKHRFYHNKSHIQTALNQLDASIDFANQPALLELALYFHDAIYNPMSSSNKQDSADLAASFLLANNVPQEHIQCVINLIMATEYTSKPIIDSDEKLLLDIDLSILGSDPVTFECYESNIRKEYKWIPIFIYKKKRKEILLSFLNQEKIYLTPYFFKHYEKQAQKNLRTLYETHI